MDATWLISLTLGTLLAAAVGGLAWRRHRQRLAHLQARLEDAEHSRLDLTEDNVTLRQRLAAAHHALAAQQTAPAGDLAERRAALERALDAAAPAASAWQDTLPMPGGTDGSGFAPTQPATLAGNG